MVDQQDVFYRIDADDRIIFVNDQWDRFARGNDGDSMLSSTVLGRSLWDFIDDPSTQQIYRQIVKRSRAGNAVTYPLRCDAPNRRRFLRMNVRAAEDGAVEFRSRIVSEEPRQALDLLDSRFPRTGDLVTVCSWCEKVLVDGRWLDVEDAIEALELFQEVQLPALTHGICQACSESMNDVIADL